MEQFTHISQLNEEQLSMLTGLFSLNTLQEWDFEKNNEEFPNISIMTLSEKPSSSFKPWWKCLKFGHNWQASMRHRREGSNCSICANRKLLVGYNDFATRNPELVEKWKEVPSNPDPSTVLFSATKITVEFPCEKGHLYPITPAHLSKGRRCCYCGGTKVLKGFNDLASKCPDSVEWWDYEKNDNTPDAVRYGSDTKRWWKCLEFGHSYPGSINHFYHGKRCAVCAGKRTDDTTNLTITHPLLAKEWDYDKNAYGPETISAGHDERIWWKCEKCKHEWRAYVYNRTSPKRPQGCPECAKGATSSRGEKQIFEFLTNNGILAESILTHTRMKNASNGKMFELDIYIPKMNIAIEFNGVYYHSEKFVEKDYHFNKYKACQRLGIQLIQIWEDEWNYSQSIIEKMLLHKLNLTKDERIYARKTIVQEIDYGKAAVFLNNNHIQGFVNSSLYFGLFYKDELISVLAIRKENNGRTFNIARYATSKHVVGGFTKLLSYIEANYDFENFITFSDNCVSNGLLYKNNGFAKDGELKPDYMYLVKRQYREHKFKYRKKKFKNDASLQYEEGMTERQLAGLNNMLRIYDAGKIRWVRHVSR